MSTETLSDLLAECARLLRQVGEDFWAKKIEQAVARGPVISDLLVGEILGWFGGMGSFNDLIISEINGHSVSTREEPELNDRLQRLRSQIYERADAFRGV